jgi:hypothetical protein
MHIALAILPHFIRLMHMGLVLLHYSSQISEATAALEHFAQPEELLYQSWEVAH